MSVLKVAVHGAAGRVGQLIVAMGADDDSIEIVAALDRPDHPKLGTDIGLVVGVGELGVPLAAELPSDVVPDALIDFSQPAGTMNMLRVCVERRIPFVVATTGLSPDQLETLDAAAKEIPIVFAPNMSVGVNVAMKLAQIAAKALAQHDADVEILERHHRFKVDSPSGTALKLGELIAHEMGISHFTHGREGLVGARPHDEIAYHAIRTGDNAGEHTIVFGMLGETIEISAKCSSRAGYVRGAFAAARFLQGKTAGKFDMFDVLGFRSLE
ncbi:MAG: 4-hydroxy-tetrahydrodipicolinate reductase [Planctomycetia bacterium]|nr:4-hydroxy-tetrahydrodipicolinate reductase [Planctomycetia bacterium]